MVNHSHKALEVLWIETCSRCLLTQAFLTLSSMVLKRGLALLFFDNYQNEISVRLGDGLVLEFLLCIWCTRQEYWQGCYYNGFVCHIFLVLWGLFVDIWEHLSNGTGMVHINIVSYCLFCCCCYIFYLMYSCHNIFCLCCRLVVTAWKELVTTRAEIVVATKCRPLASVIKS